MAKTIFEDVKTEKKDGILWVFNPSPAEPGYVLPAAPDQHCLPLSMWIYINNLDQVIWLAEN